MTFHVLAFLVTGWPPGRLCVHISHRIKSEICLNFRCNREFGEYDLKVCWRCDVTLWYKYKRVEYESRRATEATSENEIDNKFFVENEKLAT